MEMTWDDAEDFVKVAGLDKDEYFHITNSREDIVDEALRKMVIWDEKGIRNIAIWWAPGANEGYYVHVDRVVIIEGKPVYKIAMLGKFWTPVRAAFASDILVRLFYHLFKDPKDLIEAAKKNYDEVNG